MVLVMIVCLELLMAVERLGIQTYDTIQLLLSEDGGEKKKIYAVVRVRYY